MYWQGPHEEELAQGGWVSLVGEDGTVLIREVDLPLRDSLDGSMGLHDDPLGMEGGLDDDGDGALPVDAGANKQLHDSGGSGGGGTTPDAGSGAEGLVAELSNGRYRAVHEFLAEQEGDLSLQRGNVVLLRSKTHEHWWEGVLEHQPAVVGVFPYNYVQPLLLVRATRDIAAGEEITARLPPELAALATSREGSGGRPTQTLQVLLPNGAFAGQEIEFPFPIDHAEAAQGGGSSAASAQQAQAQGVEDDEVADRNSLSDLGQRWIAGLLNEP
jgi:hypothetical protein